MPSYLFSEKTGSSSVSTVISQNYPEHSLSLAGKRVVIVEDEGMTQLVLGRMLHARGVIIAGRANNGLEGVEVVLRERPDFVLMDINMPIMDGLEASKRILAQVRVCIVLLTAYSEAEFRQRAAALDTCGYVIKPVTSETLLPVLEAAYHKFHERQKPSNP